VGDGQRGIVDQRRHVRVVPEDRLAERDPFRVEMEKEQHRTAIIDVQAQLDFAQCLADRRGIAHLVPDRAKRVGAVTLDRHETNMRACGRIGTGRGQTPEVLELDPVLGVIQQAGIEADRCEDAHRIESTFGQHRGCRDYRADPHVATSSRPVLQDATTIHVNHRDSRTALPLPRRPT